MFLYKKEMFNNLKYNFYGAGNIQQSYAQCLQDMFVLSVLNGKRNGFYLEIGANQPVFINNTYLLESQFGWQGISVDIDPQCQSMFRSSGRKSNFILSDALVVDYEKEMIKNNFPKQVDYLSLDIEPIEQTFNCLKKLPLDTFRFSVITFETDFYGPTDRNLAERVRKESREILTNKDYVLIAGNISNMDDQHPFEDWYIDGRVFNKDAIDRFKRTSDNPIASHKYMLNGI